MCFTVARIKRFNCHNVVLAGGESGRSTDGQWQMAHHHGVLTDYSPGPFVDFASVDSSLQHDCYWSFRHLGLVKGKSAPAYAESWQHNFDQCPMASPSQKTYRVPS